VFVDTLMCAHTDQTNDDGSIYDGRKVIHAQEPSTIRLQYRSSSSRSSLMASPLHARSRQLDSWPRFG